MTPQWRAIRSAVLPILLAISACAPAEPPFGTVASDIPPLQAQSARLYFYRALEPYETNAPTTAYLNGKEVAVAWMGSVTYRDVAPGQYLISVFSRGRYPNQFKTVVLRPGETAYVRIDSLKNWAPCGGGGDFGIGIQGCVNTFVVQIVAPAEAQFEMRDLSFVRE